jgi:predicted ATPase
MADYQVRHHNQLGSSGEFTTQFLSTFGSTKIQNSQLHHPNARSDSLIHEVEAWMGEFSPGTRIEVTPLPGMDLVNLQYSFVFGTEVSDKYRSTNVGFGLTYSLPILVAVLASPADSLILLENPEAHLHPKGQAQMGLLLAMAANGGAQLLVETHSDHVLNGIRLAVHSRKISADNVQIHFFQTQQAEGAGRVEVISSVLNPRGRIDRWPEDFFDQWDKSLETLLGE